jgi:hypothetical protein
MYMRTSKAAKLVLAALLAVSVTQLIACAADPRYSQGREWVQYNEMEKQRLDQAGFPQYNNGP